jgi:hypothetical protein
VGRPKDGWGRAELIAGALKLIPEYAGVPITIRQLFYRMVAKMGLPDTKRVYKRLVAAMTVARWAGTVDMEAFIDRERTMEGRTEGDPTDLEDKIDKGKTQVKAWMRVYELNRWENQPHYVEVWIEARALQGVFEGPCSDMDVGLGVCKGYASLSFLHEAVGRFDEAYGRGQECIILYFGDWNPSGEDIPRSFWENIARMEGEITVKVIALNPIQITRWNLPGVPAKTKDSRSRGWTGDTVELDALDPHDLQKLCRDAIATHFDEDLYRDLKDREDRERQTYRVALYEHVMAIANGEYSEEDEDDDEA